MLNFVWGSLQNCSGAGSSFILANLNLELEFERNIVFGALKTTSGFELTTELFELDCKPTELCIFLLICNVPQEATEGASWTGTEI